MSRLSLLLLSVLSCRDSTVSGTGGELRVSPESLEWPSTVVGRRSTRQLTLTNTSRSRLQLNIELDGGAFDVARTLEFEGGGELVLDVSFAPVREGPALGSLYLLEEERSTVALSGEGRVVTCPQVSLSCLTLTPDDEGRCVEQALPDGTACAERCLESGQCRGGTCVGAARVCDDGNACTSDRCSADRGCVFEPVECAAPGEACQTAQCDPRLGCVLSDVKDGARCGPNDCVNAQVCIAGSCRRVTAPEGSVCSEATFCQAEGVCRNSRCQQPPPRSLTPVWQIEPTTHQQNLFTGVADSQGNLYWLLVDSSTRLVSVNRDGQQRFRVAFPLRPRISDAPLFLISDDAVGVILTEGPLGDRLEVRSTRDGALLWSKGRAHLPATFGLGSRPLYLISAGTVGTPAQVWINWRSVSAPGGADWRSLVAAYDPVTGAQLWETPATYVNEAIADDDSLYLHDTNSGHSHRAVDTAGKDRWLLVDERAVLTAVANGQLLTAFPPTLRDTATGAIQQRLDAGIRDVNLLTAEQLVANVSGHCRGGAGLLDRTAGTWSSWLEARCSTEALLTHRNTLLVGARSEVLEVNNDASVRLRCPLPSPVDGPAVLSGNRWIVSDGFGSISAYDLPVMGPGRGWVGLHGSSARSRRPQR